MFLEGHFEGFPVVPGVVQVGWVLDAAQAALGEAPRLAAVENLKFKELLLPGQRFRLEVEWTAARDVLRFRLAARSACSRRAGCGCGKRARRDALAGDSVLRPRRGPARRDRLPGRVTASRRSWSTTAAAPPPGEILASLAAAHPWLEVHRHETNRGKGAAVATGYRLAAARGASHALQLDADGQHDAADVPRFLEAMAKHPDALVLGAPVFDASVPRSRLYGRQISRGLVWLFTLSFAVRDPLCGFRGIPLAATLALLGRQRLGERMDFDPELAVRLYWEGLEVVNLPTRVRYPAGGLSHFDVVWDDLRLAGLYVRLAGGLLRRAPRLLLGRAPVTRPSAPIEEVVPHAGTMLLVGPVLEHRPEFTRCRVEVARSALFARRGTGGCPPSSPSSGWPSASPPTAAWSPGPSGCRCVRACSSARGACACAPTTSRRAPSTRCARGICAASSASSLSRVAWSVRERRSPWRKATSACTWWSGSRICCSRTGD